MIPAATPDDAAAGLGAPLRWASRAFDRLERGWASPRTHNHLGLSLVVGFLGALLVIEANRRGLLGPTLAAWLPTRHFYAVDFAFTLLLMIEIVALVFALAESVSDSLGKQFEVVSLILLRQSFKGFIGFREPIELGGHVERLGPMVVDALGALGIFIVLGFYYRSQRHRPITADTHERDSFIAEKKVVGCSLLLAFLVIAASEATRELAGGPGFDFFAACYTVLIFSDILIVLLSIRHSSTYRVLFRNSGFALATVFARLALTAPAYANAALGLGAAGFALLLTWAYNSSVLDLGE